MKRTIAILLTAALFMALVACSAKKGEPVAETDDGQASSLAGGWTVNSEYGEAKFPEDALAALNSGLEGLAGANHVPVAYLGSQVVAGMNYAFLCRTTMVTANPVTELSIVKVYHDLEGKDEITQIKSIQIVECIGGDGGVDFDPAELVGGWSVLDACGAGLEGDVQKAFDKAMEGFAGVGYVPLACLGSQVVAGTNYAILCKATTVTANPVASLAVVTVYADLNGNAEITSVSGFDFTK